MQPLSEGVELLKRTGVYFYFPEKTVSEDVEQYTTMIIVTGLRDLGVPCYSNVAHPGLNLKAISDAGKHLVVLDLTEANYSDVLMQAFSKFDAKGKLINSRADVNPGILTPENIPALTTHENQFIQFRAPRHSWAFGLSRKWEKRHVNDNPFERRKPTIVRNFRPSPSQGVRFSLDFSLLPHLEKYFEIDRAHDVEGYAGRLANATGCLAYGGEFQGDLGKNGFFQNHAGYKPLAAHRTFLRDPVVTRWDSWRLWESLAAGCLTFQLNFETYGFRLPEMPEPWKHYVPLDLADPKGSVEQLMDRKPEWAAIASRGKAWALEHYTSVPTAARFARIAAKVLKN